MQRTFNTRSDKILNILNNLKYSLAGPGMKTEEIKVGSLPGELKRGFAEALRNIEKKPDALLYWIDEAVNALSEAPDKERSERKSLKMPKPSEKFETEFWMRERELRKERAKIIEDISQSLGYGSSPLNAKEKMEMAKEFYDDVIKTGVYKTYSAFSHIYSENDIKNVLVSLFKEKYPQPTGTEVKVALKIINEYF